MYKISQKIVDTLCPVLCKLTKKTTKLKLKFVPKKSELIRAQTYNFQNESTRFALTYKNERNSLQNSFFYFEEKIKTTIVLL